MKTRSKGQYKFRAFAIIQSKTNFPEASSFQVAGKQTGPADSHKTEQVSEIYAWQIAISHDRGVKGNGGKITPRTLSDTSAGPTAYVDGQRENACVRECVSKGYGVTRSLSRFLERGVATHTESRYVKGFRVK